MFSAFGKARSVLTIMSSGIIWANLHGVLRVVFTFFQRLINFHGIIQLKYHRNMNLLIVNKYEKMIDSAISRRFYPQNGEFCRGI